MGSVVVERGRFKGWEAWRLLSGPLELVVVPQVGGRIMGLLWRGHDLAFTQPERQGLVEDLVAVADLRARKREMGFPLWGGDKTWLGPQDRWTEGVPFLDLDSGAYEAVLVRHEPDEAALRLVSPACRETGVRLERTLAVSSGAAGWRLAHRLVNASPAPVEWALWDVLMLRRPGRVYLPRNPSSAFPAGVKQFANEGSLCNLASCAFDGLGDLAVIRCDEARAFKAGVDSAEGWLLGVVETPGGLVGCSKRVPTFPGAAYPHGCVAEVFNAERYDYLELEILGPIVRLAPGDSLTLEERVGLFDLERWPASADEVRRHAEAGSAPPAPLNAG
jgi:hypothetical protein